MRKSEIFCNRTKIITQPKNGISKPIESIGNQLNQGDVCKSGIWIYMIRNSDEYQSSIVKFEIDNVEDKEVIFSDETQKSQISVLGDWIYFIAEAYGADKPAEMDLYRIRTDGSGKMKLADTVFSYVLCEDEIYYDSAATFAMSLDGTGKRKVLREGNYLLALDAEWLYYEKLQGEELIGPYRIRLDGSGTEMLLDSRIDSSAFLAQGDSVYFSVTEESSEGIPSSTSIVKKTMDGTETLLTKMSVSGYYDVTSLNKEGKWLYYSFRGKLYRFDASGSDAKELIYSDPNMVSVLLYGEDLLISNQKQIVYIGKDGNVVKCFFGT